MKQWVFLIHLFLTGFVSTNIYGQLTINEICPTNTSLIANYNGEYDDWFEIHNSGTTSINLGGYGVTDDSTKPFRFSFPPNFSLGANQKILVFASKHTNGFIVDHWEMAVNAGSSWKYKAGTASLDTNWRNVSFDASSWASGNGGIGFGDGDDNTIIPVCVSLMMRRSFSIADTSQIIKAVLNMDYDDGFVAYLNGVEIARANIGFSGVRPAWNELAWITHEAKTYRGGALDSFYIDRSVLQSALRPGTNVLAIEVHNNLENSNDMSSIPYLFFGMKSPGLTFMQKPNWFTVPDKDFFNANFKLSRDGETVYLFNPSGGIVDKIQYPLIDINHSYSRIPDGTSNWCFTPLPSAGISNNSSQCFTEYALQPIISRDGGYYNSSISVSLLSPTPGGVIHYTINGDTPDETDAVYSSPISITATQTIRARVFANGMLPGPTITNTYIINGLTKLSTFSITTDSLNLWDYNTGIYAMGPNASPTSPYKGANFWMDWSKPATIEYYDNNKNKVIRFDADIEIYGNYSQAKPQKSFEIKLRDSYGTGSFNYSMYPDKPFIEEIDNFILRNAGTDWNKVHFRDGFMQRLMKPTFINYLSAQPAIAYLNGQYWGVYHIYENHDHHWLKNNYGLDRDNIDLLRESGTSISISEGKDDSFWKLYNYTTTEDPQSAQYYTEVDKMLDLKNYADYFIAETFYNNGDWIGEWTNNIKLWRKQKEGEKWKYLLYDLDYGLGLKNNIQDNRLAMARNPEAFSYSSEMFDAMLKNPSFKRYFINRYADLMNTVFLPSNMNEVMHSYKDSMEYDMSAHFAKWGSNNATWDNYINGMMGFANARPDIMKDFIKAEFNLNGVVKLTFATNPASAGRIEVSTIIPTSYPWTGDYFNGNPVTLTAIPNPGYTFSHWRSNKVINSNNSNQTVTYNFDRDDVIKANFTGSAVNPKISVSEFNYNSVSSFNSGDWIELHNYTNVALDITGWKISDGIENNIFVFPTGTRIPANGYLVIVEDSVKFCKQYPGVNNWIGELGFNLSNSGDQIRLYNHTGALYLSFLYQDISPWPLLADGAGYTCEHTADNAEHNNGSNWFAGCFGGSPGRAHNNSYAFTISLTGSTTYCVGMGTQLIANSFANNISTYQWKRNGSNISGATESSYTVTQNGSYSVKINNNGCSGETPSMALSQVTQEPVPVTLSASRCGPGSIMLSATATDSVFWYDAAQSGNLVATGNDLNIANLTESTTYYAVNGRDCPSNAVPVFAEIITPTAPPVATDTFRCGPGVVTLMATDTAEIRWYNAPSGGGLLATGSYFTTGVIDQDTTYYVEAGTVCPSARIEVNVHVKSTTAPLASDESICGPGSVTLNATSHLPLFWYDEPSAGNQLGNGNSYTTHTLTETDTFYVEANTGCPSARVMAIAIVNPIPSVPVVRDTMVCQQTSLQLIADATEQVNWYDAPQGGNPVYTGMVFQTPFLSSTTVYYAANGYSCQSARVPVNVVINSAPVVSVTDGSNCGTGSVMLTASANVHPDSVIWYDAPAGNVIATGHVFVTTALSLSTKYYVIARSECTSQPTEVNAVIHPLPVFELITDTLFIESGQTIVLDAGVGYNNYSWSTGETTQQIMINSAGNYSAVIVDQNGCTATDQVIVMLSTTAGNVKKNMMMGIYPNPASDYIFVKASGTPSKVRLTIVSAEGKIIYREEIKSMHGYINQTIQLSGVASGIYIVQVEGENYSRKEKILIEKE